MTRLAELFRSTGLAMVYYSRKVLFLSLHEYSTSLDSKTSPYDSNTKKRSQGENEGSKHESKLRPEGTKGNQMHGDASRNQSTTNK